MGSRRRALFGAAALALAATSVVPASRTPRASAAPSARTGIPDGAPAAAFKPEPVLAAPAGWPFPESFSRTMGTGRMDAGAFYWTDFLYDDHGARGPAVRAPATGLAPPAGSFVYPAGPADNNGADVFRVAVGVDTSSTYWRIDWTTLADPSVPIAVWALDTDNDAHTGTSAWPAGAGVHSPGVDRFLVVSGRGAWLVDSHGSRQSVDAVGGALNVDPGARSFVVRIPRSALPVSGTWRVRLAAGLANANGNGFAPVGPDLGALPGQPPVYNVTFRSYQQENPHLNLWMDEAQSQALTLGGDISAFSHRVDWADLAARRFTPEPLPTGYTNRWYVSSIELGQGVVPDPSNSPQGDLRPNFLGRLQPYSVYVPTSYTADGPLPLTWLLHSLGVQHNQYGSINPTLLQQACEQRRSICATTLGRGPDGWYFDEAEVDFWEVWNRLASTYRLDPERTVLSGYSMGGWGTYKLGLTYPSLFAKAVPLAGPPICGIRVASSLQVFANSGRCTTEGDTTPLVENARWLPFAIHQGVVDELVPVSSVVLQSQQFDALGYRYRLQLYPTGDHLASSVEDPPYLGDEGAQMGNLTRKRDPGHITYTWYPHIARPQWGIGPIGAYWVHDISAVDGSPGARARVDAVSGERPEPAVTSQQTSGADPTAALATFTERTWREGTAPVPAPALSLDLRNVAGLTLDLAGAGFGPDTDGTAKVVSDRPTHLALAGLSPGAGASVDGSAAAPAQDGVATVALAAGEHHIAFGPHTTVVVRAAGSTPTVLGLELAATGTKEAVLLVAGLACLLLALTLRRLSLERQLTP